ncbi:EF-hand domain-containing protein [Aphanothece sacrum]|uniref:Cyclic nucleotide-binding protein n=1 Tax=Aphanothece sacrum FPU1 TaxID=1920663 RepID=A0A401IH42_APHSA|nr:EF-hand domain-containing protein [Aphanothece sacrum]GBF80615.1 cyclic nucleotide-binding protein [Aphanothece sacrum FPU1]GBF83995.1 signal transduction protein [Aphanothece sacrum FPU3]
MFAKIPERQMLWVRRILAIGWLVLITSLFYDPISSWLTLPEHTWSPLSISRITQFDCVQVQGKCMTEIPYAIGGLLFWTLIVPFGVFVLMVFGHDAWRRVCPLSYFSQLPRNLGFQRSRKRVDAKTGKTRHEVIKVDPNSWLNRNHIYLQMVLLYLGITGRILFYNSNRLTLGLFLVGTIIASMVVGYLYGGKSWCQYICPMAPVEQVFTQPRALLNSSAHTEEGQKITQSMCRTVNTEGKEHSACIACHSPCIDIDAERSYWEEITTPKYQWLYYGYVGLTVGYFVYPFLFAGNWEYLMSAAWSHQENQLNTLFNPGFYIFNTPIAIPKLVAAPLTIGVFGLVGYFLGRKLEKMYKGYLLRHHKLVNTEVVRHRLFTLATFFIFNFFFIFGGSNLVRLLPNQLKYLFPVVMAVCSGLWLYRTWPRNPYLYQRESLASRLRKQLSKLNLNIGQFLDNRSLDDLNVDEVYVLAKILPGFDKEKRLKAYKGVLKESITERYVDSESSLDILLQMRLELNITEEEHRLVLTELEVEDPILVNPSKKNNHEEWLRQESYRQALLDTVIESSQEHPSQGIIIDLFDIITGKKPFESFNELINSLSTKELQTVNAIREEYAITPQEEKEIITHINPRQLWHSMAYTFSVIEYLDAIAEGRTPISGKIEEMNEEQKAFCRVIFNKFDKDGNDCLSAAELRSLLRAVGRPYSSERVQELMDIITGRPNSNRITFAEFSTLLHRDLAEGEESEMLKRFHLFDADGSGYITLEELRVCLQDIDEAISDADIEAMLKHADTSGDEQISYEEFCQLFGQLQTH